MSRAHECEPFVKQLQPDPVSVTPFLGQGLLHVRTNSVFLVKLEQECRGELGSLHFRQRSHLENVMTKVVDGKN